ncbi:MAG TPA: ribosome biogenesis GTPase Der [Caulobacteraceae bacterium]|jgi:GTP-binding protein
MTLKVAIVGRPNVGKSTLFNRLAGKKLAIVDDRPGVTRDRRYASGRIGDLELELIDTAGFEDVDDSSLEARMRIQTEKAVDEADVSLFVFDSREGVVPLDEIFAELLRRKNRPVVVVANKAEGKAGDIGTNEGYALGLGEPLALSAEHGEGIADLYQILVRYDEAKKAELAALAPPVEETDEDAPIDAIGDEEEEPIDPEIPIRIAIVGRPNAGKSTLVNRLIGEDRMLTGPEAGITRDAIPVEWSWGGRKIRLVDTAGLRRKARVHEKLEKLSTSDAIRAITFAEVVVLVMDADGAFETQDLQIADLVEREGRALVYCIAKFDLVEGPQTRLKELQETADRHLPQLRGTPLVALSAQTGRGVNRLMPAIIKAHKDWSTKVKTRDLNDWLAMAVQRHPPPAVDGKRIRPKYMAQTKARPPTFVLFASRAAHLPESYRRYLINSLRESFDLPGIPIRVTVKANTGSDPTADTPAGDRARKYRAKRTSGPAKPGPPKKKGTKGSAPKR